MGFREAVESMQEMRKRACKLAYTRGSVNCKQEIMKKLINLIGNDDDSCMSNLEEEKVYIDVEKVSDLLNDISDEDQLEY